MTFKTFLGEGCKGLCNEERTYLGQSWSVMLIGFLFSTDHVVLVYEDLGLARVSVQETE